MAELALADALLSAGEFNGAATLNSFRAHCERLFSMTKGVPRVRRFGEPAFCGYVAPRFTVEGS
ncbi:hypothetical protein ACFRK5_00850 [Streptomyces niveus]|uniref:hypothetical protein n=1 Tax=Streptomyces niveus TaxID=193462 RepID=UPI00369D6C85